MGIGYDNRDKMKLTDRILVLKVMDDKKPKSSTGMVDSRLFNGGAELHCVKEEDTNLWYFKMSGSHLPTPLRQKFTTFSLAKEHAANYFKNRNLEISKVIE